MKRVIFIITTVLTVIMFVAIVALSLSIKEPIFELTETTYPVDIPIGNQRIITLQLYGDASCNISNNSNYWDMQDGTQIYRTVNPLSDADKATLKYNEEYSIYYSNVRCVKEFDTYTIDIISNKDILHYYIASLALCQVKTVPVLLEASTQLDTLPLHTETELIKDNNGMFMPALNTTTLNSKYTSSFYAVDYATWIESYILDRKQEDLIDDMLNVLVANTYSDEPVRWYMDSNYMYFEKDDHIICAKKLHLNSWYIYVCSSNMKDAALTGIQSVHAE